MNQRNFKRAAFITLVSLTGISIGLQQYHTALTIMLILFLIPVIATKFFNQ